MPVKVRKRPRQVARRAEARTPEPTREYNSDDLTDEEKEFIEKYGLLIDGGPAELTNAKAPPREVRKQSDIRLDPHSEEAYRVARMRLLRIEELLTLGYNFGQIHYIVNEELRNQGLPEFDKDTYLNDINKCKRAWADRIDTAREELVAMQFQRYENTYRRSVGKDDVYAMLRVIEAESKLLGLEAPKKVQVNSDLTIADITEERRLRAKEFFERNILSGSNGDREVIPARVSEVSDGG